MAGYLLVLTPGELMTTSSEVIEGLELKTLTPGSLIDVETESRHYRIEFLGGNAVRISGHPQYCPDPIPAELEGSIGKEGFVELGHIERGSRLMFSLKNFPFMTSRIVSVHVNQPEAGVASRNGI